MKNYTITVNGNVYNVTVEEGTTAGAAPVVSAAKAAPAPKGTDMEAEEFCSISKTSIYNGFGCAYRAIAESDYFKKLPR